jgi:hypothetical protein
MPTLLRRPHTPSMVVDAVCVCVCVCGARECCPHTLSHDLMLAAVE